MEEQPNFKSVVKEWIGLDDTIKGATSDLKSVRQRHKELREKMIQNMEENEIDTFELKKRGEQLRLDYKDKKIRPKKADILKKMAEFLQDPSKALEMYDFVFEHPETECAPCLRRKKLNGRGRRRKKKDDDEQ